MIVYGIGRVGGGLTGLARETGTRFHAVTRTKGHSVVAEDGVPGPILVCTNADDLADVIRSVPSDRHGDLVFTQNGMLDTFLATHALQENTRGLLYFAAAKRGDRPVAGEASVFSGPWADVVVDWFDRVGLPAVAVDRGRFTEEMAGKLIWNCVFGLMSDVYGLPVGELVRSEKESIRSLVGELVSISNAALGTALKATDVHQNVCAYSLTIPNYRGSLKQHRWRNGWFLDAALEHGVEDIFHQELMDAARSHP